MRNITYFIYFFAIMSCATRKHKYDLIINNIAVIDPVREKTIPSQAIFIKDGKILKVEDSNTSNFHLDSLVVDGTGKYAIAGFWNMHTHISWKEDLNETIFPVILSYGITGVRDMGGNADILNEDKKFIEENPSLGPILFGPGPLIDGLNPIHPEFSIALTRQNFKVKLDSLVNSNIDFIKVYSLLPKELVEEIANYSKVNNIPFTGHISEYMSPLEASELNQRSFEHLNRIEDFRKDTIMLNSFIKSVKLNGSWLCPTLII